MNSLDCLISDAVACKKSANQNIRDVKSMVNVAEYKELYKKAKEMRIGEALQLIREAKSEDEKSFYAHILNLHFQQKQKDTIERNLF